ncbi:MAG: WecB/TagA/CpsF family glycosyltransferase [Bacteroidetes bacterium]|nr:WecB/TagA/CpsF family glycosyltransferase [Bacteroidota bacterium]
MIQKNEQFLKSMLLADYILIDGIGFQTYFKFLMGISVPNMNGTDLSPILIQSAKKKSISVAFYGTTKEQIKLAAENQNKLFGENTIYYSQDGYSPLIWENIQPNSILMVGMGSPLQENWVFDNKQQIQERNILVVTVGGFFDFASGFYVRAPKWVRKIRLEWAWRTMLHPARHYKKG